MFLIVDVMTLTYSARSRAIEPFHVMALLQRANELQAAGFDVIHLEIGEPDFTTAEPIIQAGQVALASGQTRYTAARGLPALHPSSLRISGTGRGTRHCSPISGQSRPPRARP